MSTLNKVEPVKLSELPGGLTEVFLDNINDDQNEIKKYPLAPEFTHLNLDQANSSKEWSQVFDLGDATLVW